MCVHQDGAFMSVKLCFGGYCMRVRKLKVGFYVDARHGMDRNASLLKELKNFGKIKAYLGCHEHKSAKVVDSWAMILFVCMHCALYLAPALDNTCPYTIYTHCIVLNYNTGQRVKILHFRSEYAASI